jgi:hypothetical protein
MVTFHEFKLFHPTLFLAIYGNFFITFGYFNLFHFRLFLVILNYFILGYLQLL